MPSGAYPPRTRRVDLDGQLRNVVEWGEMGKPVLVLQHGMRDHALSWSWVAEHLAGRYHVVAPDLRGHGDSDWSPDGNYTLAGFVIDLAQIVEIYGLKEFGLLGHSLGGQIALRYAASFPERVASMILIEGIELPLIRQERASSTPYPQRVREWIDNDLMRRVRLPRFYPDVAAAAQRMSEANPLIDSETVAYLAEAGVIEVASRGFRWKYDNACRFRAPEDQRGHDLDEILEAIDCPTLLAYGADSWIAPPPAERLARVRNYQLVQFADASHWLHHQRRAEFCQMTNQFFADPTTFLADERHRYA